MYGMRIRGLFGIAVIALLSGCGGAAVAAAPEVERAEPAIDVEAIARDEIAAIDALGYPTELATWDFRDEFVNDNGGTAWASGDTEGHTTVVVSTNAESYRQFSDDIEAAIRSTVRHEFGHALMYWLFPNGAEEPLSKICLSVSTGSIQSGGPANECAAEVVSAILAGQRGDDQVPFYKLTISDRSYESTSLLVSGVTEWTVS